MNNTLPQEIEVTYHRTASPELIGAYWKKHWGDDFMVTRGEIIRPDMVRGIVARVGEQMVALLTYRIVDRSMEITSLDSDMPGRGIGSSLLAQAEHSALAHICLRVWLITTNDNLEALAFYQRRGYQLTAVYPDAVEETRKYKPQIPEYAFNEIPIRDELLLEKSVP